MCPWTPKIGDSAGGLWCIFTVVREFFRITLIAALSLPVVACTGPSGIKGSKQLNELDASERTEACENLDDYYDTEVSEERVRKFVCIFSTILAQDVAECEVAYEACLMEPLMMAEDDSCLVTEPLTCTATVEEMEACFDEQIRDFITLTDMISCQALFAGTVELDPPAGPECSALAQKCPDLYDDET